ncbi:MAG: hypothetical protein AAFN70_07055, partial [Planctomycetota bacterium]
GGLLMVLVRAIDEGNDAGLAACGGIGLAGAICVNLTSAFLSLSIGLLAVIPGALVCAFIVGLCVLLFLNVELKKAAIIGGAFIVCHTLLGIVFALLFSVG